MKYAILVLAALLALPLAARAESPMETLAQQVLALLGKPGSDVFLKGVSVDDPSVVCRIEVTSDKSIPLYEVRLSTEDNRLDFTLSSAERWDVTLVPGDANTIHAIGTVDVHQSVPGIGLPLGTKHMENELLASKDGQKHVDVSISHKVSAFSLGDGNAVLRCRF